MPFQQPEEIGYGYVVERYVTSKGSGRPRYLDLKSRRLLRPGGPHAERFARHLTDDAATITDAELEALLGYEWRSRLTAAWLIGVGRRADAEILASYLDRYLPRTDLRYDQPAALGALLRLDAHLGTHHADRFTRPEGLWDQWVNALTHLRDDPAHTPAALRRWTDLYCDFADGWACPKRSNRPGGPAGPDVSG
jgi:hypothetical protein